MRQQELNRLALRHKEHYEQIMADSNPYEYRGMLHSEILMVCVLAVELGVEQIIESGRARGQSTELIARFIQGRNIEFHSIDCLKDNDSVFAEKRLYGLPVKIHYADSFELIPSLINGKKTLVVIDGPKGKRMWSLGDGLLKHPSVVGICFHDCYKGSPVHRIIKKKKLQHLSSDDEEYVRQYKYLDVECWEKVKPRPYGWGGSYGPTLVFIR